MAVANRKKSPGEFDPIVVNGCLIEPNTIYEVVAKEPPATTPEIYHMLGSTKERIPGVSNSVSLTQSNTGFFAYSDIFNEDDKIKNNWAEREKRADEYYRIFAEPLKTFIADIEQIRIPTNDDFFNKNYDREGKNMFSSYIGEGIQFNTANPLSRFQLYIAIVEGQLVMKGEREEDEKEMGLRNELDPLNNDAQYAFVSINNRRSKKEQMVEIENECLYRFEDLLRKDKDLLVGMLQYVGVPALKSATKGELRVAYNKNIQGVREKTRAFADVIDKLDKDTVNFKQEIDILERLKTKKGRQAITKEGSRYFMDEIPMGSNAKSIAATLMKDEDLLKKFYIKTDD